jgi:hypothetical protein
VEAGSVPVARARVGAGISQAGKRGSLIEPASSSELAANTSASSAIGAPNEDRPQATGAAKRMAAIDRRCGHRPAITQQKTRIGQQRTPKCEAKTDEHA